MKIHKGQKVENEKLTWLAASTHHEEEKIIINIHQKILQKHPNVLLIIAPRHPERFTNIAQLLQNKNIKFNKYSKNGFSFGRNNFYLLDTLGKMDEAFNFSKFSFIGGSLFPNIGGHNPFESVRNSCLPVSGKYISNFKEAYCELKRKTLFYL